MLVRGEARMRTFSPTLLFGPMQIGSQFKVAILEILKVIPKSFKFSLRTLKEIPDYEYEAPHLKKIIKWGNCKYGLE